MKLLFNIVFFLIFINFSVKAELLNSEYVIETKGIKIGKLSWKLEMYKDYKSLMILKSEGFFSGLYKFNGQYESYGKLNNKKLMPSKYSQIWITKNKDRRVEIFFENEKIKQLFNMPKEKEFARVDFKKLTNYMDPLSSFINILLDNGPSNTIDGRRTYLMHPEENNNSKKIIIKEYTNIWADHKRNDLEYIEIFNDKDISFLPKKIKIRFKGSTFTLKQ